MHHFFAEAADISEREVRLRGENLRHLKNVLRARPGERVLISDGDGTDYECEVAELGEEEILLRICFREEIHELPADIWLFQGLPKSDKMEFILQKAVELGVRGIVPLESRNTVVRLNPGKAAAKRQRWQAIAEAAAKQSKRSIIPEVTLPMRWKDALSLLPDFSLRLIPYENVRGAERTRELLLGLRKPWKEAARPPEEEAEAEDLKKRGDTGQRAEEKSRAKEGLPLSENEKKTPDRRRKIAVFIGPEGGFSEEEIAEARAAGMECLSLGKRILRTETAALCALSLLMLFLED